MKIQRKSRGKIECGSAQPSFLTILSHEEDNIEFKLLEFCFFNEHLYRMFHNLKLWITFYRKHARLQQFIHDLILSRTKICCPGTRYMCDQCDYATNGKVNINMHKEFIWIQIQIRSLFVFSIGGLKQNVKSLLTPVSDRAFYALSHGTLGFALHGSFNNHLFQRIWLAVEEFPPIRKWLLKLP